MFFKKYHPLTEEEKKIVSATTQDILEKRISLAEAITQLPEYLTIIVIDCILLENKKETKKIVQHLKVLQEQEKAQMQQERANRKTLLQQLAKNKKMRDWLNAFNQNRETRNRLQYLQEQFYFSSLPSVSETMDRLEKKANGEQVTYSVSQRNQKLKAEIKTLQRKIKPTPQNRKRHPIIKLFKDFCLE